MLFMSFQISSQFCCRKKIDFQFHDKAGETTLMTEKWFEN